MIKSPFKKCLLLYLSLSILPVGAKSVFAQKPELTDQNNLVNRASPSEINRTKPDLVIHDPTSGVPREWTDPDFFWLNEHVHVISLGGDDLLATWTSERLVPQQVLRVVASRSHDNGFSWSMPSIIDGEGSTAAWQVPIVNSSGRVYLFYNYNDRQGIGGFIGGLRCRVSNDGGKSWSPPTDINFPRSIIDNPDIGAATMWITPSTPIFTENGEALFAYTRWADNENIPFGKGEIRDRYSHIEIMKFENLNDNPNANEIKFSWLNVDDPIIIPHEKDSLSSFAQEPYWVRLPDGRLFMTMRTNRGQTWYVVSKDKEGEIWSSPQPMRYKDGGEIMLNPVTPCPIFELNSGDYLFLFNNNDGYVFGSQRRWDSKNRRPAFISKGQYIPDAEQPIWWSQPLLFIDNDNIPWGPPGKGRLEAATYPSMTHANGKDILWYPDRKGFVVGKYISNQILESMKVPVK